GRHGRSAAPASVGARRSPHRSTALVHRQGRVEPIDGGENGLGVPRPLMTALLVAGVVVTWMAAACGAMFVYQLLRQNGRMLARLDALERELGPAAGRTRAPSFGDRSLAGSRLNRNGLTPGTKAPDFRLPRVDGGMLALAEYRGRRLLLVVSSPDCQPCAL